MLRNGFFQPDEQNVSRQNVWYNFLNIIIGLSRNFIECISVAASLIIIRLGRSNCSVNGDDDFLVICIVKLAPVFNVILNILKEQ